MGSFNGTIGFYTDEMPEPINLLSTGSTNGITQVEFSPCGRYLYSSARRSGTISSWDIRNTGGCLWEVGRDGGTNQRLYFSISSSGTLLAGGDRVRGGCGWRMGHLIVYCADRPHPCTLEWECQDLGSADKRGASRVRAALYSIQSA